MLKIDDQTKAVHRDNGNYYDKMLIDIGESHKIIDALAREQRILKRNRLVNHAKFFLVAFLQKYKLLEFLCYNGFRNAWFNDFYDYWTNVLSGRPLKVIDFLILLHEYRKKQQHLTELSWESANSHLANWQDPAQIYYTFASARKLALQPIKSPKLFRLISKNSSVLEYGCGLAPYYDCYRNFFTHLDCRWVLADIPNFPFHYAKYRYRDDDKVDFITIGAADFINPLRDKREFDLIILTTVFEHLDNPQFVSNYLLDRLKKGGLFIFDYVISEGKGMDTPRALNERKKCLDELLKRVKIIHGNIDVAQDINFTISKKIR